MKRSWKIGIIVACIVLVLGIVVACVAINNKDNGNKDKDSSSVVQSEGKDENSDGKVDTEDSKDSDDKTGNKGDKDSEGKGDAQNNGDNVAEDTPGNATAEDSLNDEKDEGKDSSSKPSGNSQTESKPSVTLTGDELTFEMTLYPEKAPVTCKNFIKLVDQGFYNGLEFTRVIENFMAQAGDTNGDGTGGSGIKIPGEFSSNGVANDISHLKGTVSMFRDPMDPNSASSQFFICYNDNCKFMDGNYAAFGKVTSGMDVVEDFQAVERETGYDGTESKPVTPITIVMAESSGEDSDGNPMIKFYVTY